MCLSTSFKVFNNLNKSLLLILSLVFAIACQNDEAKNNPTSNQTKPKPGLHELSHIPVGGAISINKVLADEKLKDITIKNFSSISATNDMKMYSILKDSVYNLRKWISYLHSAKSITRDYLGIPCYGTMVYQNG